ncbi:hypothetical protein SDC9_204369 [bioreactor metagenome]|uniref:Uncharacterized protein n=1 Tax=bioreactor metagenome TaxID=1076179 RepID=A0A645J1U7_9ZZZZ
MSAAFAILVFSANSGEVRGYALIGSLIGACIYFATLGRLLTLLSEAIISLVKRIFAFLTKKLLIPALKAVKNEIIKLHSILIRLRSRRLGRAFIHDASHGFLSASTSRKLKFALTESGVVQKKRIEKKTQEGK